LLKGLVGRRAQKKVVGKTEEKSTILHERNGRGQEKVDGHRKR